MLARAACCGQQEACTTWGCIKTCHHEGAQNRSSHASMCTWSKNAVSAPACQCFARTCMPRFISRFVKAIVQCARLEHGFCVTFVSTDHILCLLREHNQRSSISLDLQDGLQNGLVSLHLYLKPLMECQESTKQTAEPSLKNIPADMECTPTVKTRVGRRMHAGATWQNKSSQRLHTDTPKTMKAAMPTEWPAHPATRISPCLRATTRILAFCQEASRLTTLAPLADTPLLGPVAPTLPMKPVLQQAACGT